MNRVRTLFAAAVLLLALAARGEITAFVGVNVVPMDSERVLLAQTVIVDGETIETIGAVEDVPVPANARVVYGRGRWLVPGLVDMHVHIRAVDLPRYLAYGITTVRDLAGLDSVLAIVHQQAFGPRILVASKLLAGPAAQNPPFSVNVTSAQSAAAHVDEQLARGCDSIKVYDDLSRDAYDAAIRRARERGVKVAGHVTRFVDIRHAMEMQDSIEHLSGYPLGNAATNQTLAIASRDTGVWNCPTMVVFTQYVTRNMTPAAREQYLNDRRALLTALHDAGARILAGTDSGYLVPAGAALHDELDELVAAGFTRYEALVTATRAAGEYLDDPTLGVIAPGARADLVLVGANPLENLAALRLPAGVMLHGEWIAFDQRRRVVRH